MSNEVVTSDKPSLILIVDDNESNRYLLGYILRQAKHRVIEATNGEEALNMVYAARPDLVITDLDMGPAEMDGATVVEKIRADTNPAIAQTPVIISTVHEKAVDMAHKHGVPYVIPFPAAPQAVLAIVDTALMLSAPPPPEPPSTPEPSKTSAEELKALIVELKEYVNSRRDEN